MNYFGDDPREVTEADRIVSNASVDLPRFPDSLRDDPANVETEEKCYGPFPLPVGAENWRKFFGKVLLGAAIVFLLLLMLAVHDSERIGF